ncbi:MAG: DUF1799 domain-containing protein [Rhodocyclaceae bacterium]|nr:DUF1799 domain-containing protein [Rhodocyclaceae bacterium]
MMRAWLAVQTQWRWGPLGPALDYTAVRARMGDLDEEVWDGLAEMEGAAREAWPKQSG